MKIGIMGGTFDPIHNGHLMLGHAAYEAFSLDQIWFMPNGNPPHKKSETNKIHCRRPDEDDQSCDCTVSRVCSAAIRGIESGSILFLPDDGTF